MGHSARGGNDGIWLVSFMHYDLGYFDLQQKTLQPIENPFGTRLLPMSPGRTSSEMAEREGFEPPIGLHLCRISSAVHSTTLPPLQAPWRAATARGRAEF
jgi:hypothetical protein